MKLAKRLYSLRAVTNPQRGGQPARTGIARVGVVSVLTCWLLAAGWQFAAAADWPQYRFDAARSGASPDELPADLRVRWSLDLPKLEPAWPDQPRLRYDAVYQPIIVAGKLIVASPADDSVAAYDLASGQQAWRFFTGGPVRLPPASDGTRVFAGSDDGWLYALDVASGSLCWKVKAAPRSRLVLGNGRLVDTWCVRGGPVVADGKVYFAAGIWPLMGVFIQCVDAATGATVWSNSGEGAAYLTHPHGAMSFGGIAPQGALVVAGERLLVPGGRTLPAAFDRRTGQRQYFPLATKTGEHDVAASARHFVCAGGAYDIGNAAPLGSIFSSPVLDGDEYYGVGSGTLAHVSSAGLASNAGSTREGYQIPADVRVPLPDARVLIKAGRQLYAGGKQGITVFQLPLTAGQAASRRLKLEGDIGALAAGCGHLVAVSDEGRIYVLGGADPTPQAQSAAPRDRTVPAPQAGSTARAAELIRDAHVDAGYAVLLGGGDGQLARALTEQTRLHIVVLQPDRAKVERLRAEFSEAGLYGRRIAVAEGDLAALQLPPYFADLIVADDPAAVPRDAAGCQRLIRALHPYRGKAYLRLPPDDVDAMKPLLFNGESRKVTVQPAVGYTRVERSGGLVGAGNWTHEHADAANSRVSRDTLVKAPLGLLWYGGSSHEGVLPRHGHGPQPQVIDGRMIVPRIDGLRAMDIYTGRVLWENNFPGLGAYYNNTSHQSGANGTGTHFVCRPDAIYVRYHRQCLRIDPASGAQLPAIALPSALAPDQDAFWGYLNAGHGRLLGGVAASPARVRWNRRLSRVSMAEAPQAIESQTLFAMNRRTGELLWSARARHGFRHNAICMSPTRVYAIDRQRPPRPRFGEVDERPPIEARLVVFDAATGKVLWSKSEGVFGSMLCYSAEKDVLVESGFVGVDTLGDEARGIRAYRASDGLELWSASGVSGPPLLRGDWVIVLGGALGLLDGKPVRSANPANGEPRVWTWTREYGCNAPAGSQHLLTFRSGAAGYYDLARLGGTGSFGGFRSSCTNNLIVAGGLLTAPDYTRTCTCSYQNQTSLALYPDDEAEMWTRRAESGELELPVRRLGLNFGAPGSRVDDGGTLWVEYPYAVSKPLTSAGRALVEMTPAPQPAGLFRQHASTVGGPMPWVGASGIKGVQSIRVRLGRADSSPRNYTVRLYFAEPEDLHEGERRFNVAIQGRNVLQEFDIVAAAGGAHRSVVKKFKRVSVTDDLTIRLTPDGERPAVLCGLEVVAE